MPTRLGLMRGVDSNGRGVGPERSDEGPQRRRDPRPPNRRLPQRRHTIRLMVVYPTAATSSHSVVVWRSLLVKRGKAAQYELYALRILVSESDCPWASRDP